MIDSEKAKPRAGEARGFKKIDPCRFSDRKCQFVNSSRSSEDRAQNLELDHKTLDESVLDREEIEREQAIWIDNLTSKLDDEPAVESATLQTTTDQAPDQSLDVADDIAAVEALEAKEALLEQLYDDPSQQTHKVTDPVLLQRRRDLYFMIKGWEQCRDTKQRLKQREWNQLFDAASARIHATEREAKADARRARDTQQKQVKRAGEITDKRIAALDRACAKHRSNHFLVNMTGRSIGLAEFREALTEARRQHGPKASLVEIAATYTALSGKPMTKDQARRQLEDVQELEAPKGAWYRWRNQ